MTIVFFGNTKYSTIGLQIVHKTYPISLIVTKKLDFNPVKKIAEVLKIKTLETNNLDEEVVKKIKETKPDFLIVEDYGLILPQEILDLPKYASLNIHHSLLPKYRGPSPAPAAILAGDKISGVSVIKMVDEVDAGDILSQTEYELTPNENTDSLLTKLNQLGGELMISVIKQYLEGSTNPIHQDNSKVSYTKHFSKDDGYFDLPAGRQVSSEFMEKLDRMIRAYYPWPGVWTKWRSSKGASKIVKFLPDGKIQMEGKKVLSFKDFLNGYPNFPLKNLV